MDPSPTSLVAPLWVRTANSDHGTMKSQYRGAEKKTKVNLTSGSAEQGESHVLAIRSPNPENDLYDESPSPESPLPPVKMYTEVKWSHGVDGSGFPAVHQVNHKEIRAKFCNVVS